MEEWEGMAIGIETGSIEWALVSKDWSLDGYWVTDEETTMYVMT